MSRLDHGTYSRSQVCTDGKDGKPCDECKRAYNEYMREYRRNNPEKYQREKTQTNKLARAKTILANRHYGELAQILKEME